MQRSIEQNPVWNRTHLGIFFYKKPKTGGSAIHGLISIKPTATDFTVSKDLMNILQSFLNPQV
jgi:hypothetical protein